MWTLTGHVIYNPAYIYKFQLKTTQDRDVQSITNHPVFVGGRSLLNDIALLHLKSEFELNDNVNTVCLPEFGEENDFDPEDCHAMGWGKDRSRTTI